MSSDESRLSIGVDRLASCSTPLKNGVNTSHPDVSLTSPVTPHSKSYERCDTPRLSHRHSRSQEKSCLGDYIATAHKSAKKTRSSNNRNLSDDSDVKVDLDLSNSDMFPEIGARKSTSLRSDKRRIKPTNIDQSKKSLSLNSFNSECFQQPSPMALEDNVMFKQQKLQPKELSQSFDAERNILKQERHKLMEKFNTLNASTSPKTPQVKVMHRESLEKSQNYVEADASQVVYKDKLDMLVDIYDSLLRNNLVLSINMEIYFLISIILSKQLEDDYSDATSKLNESSLQCHILRTIHNSTYFAVRCLWLQRGLLELILDKNSLKLLGENKKVRAFCGELAKCLLNRYGVRCEQAGAGPPPSPGPLRGSQAGVVAFNAETDCADNFPSTLSFHNFKKQRDMFYEIVRSALHLTVTFHRRSASRLGTICLANLEVAESAESRERAQAGLQLGERTSGRRLSRTAARLLPCACCARTCATPPVLASTRTVNACSVADGTTSPPRRRGRRRRARPAGACARASRRWWRRGRRPPTWRTWRRCSPATCWAAANTRRYGRGGAGGGGAPAAPRGGLTRGRLAGGPPEQAGAAADAARGLGGRRPRARPALRRRRRPLQVRRGLARLASGRELTTASFGREMLVSCEHAALRAHVRDALAAQLVALDAAPLEPMDAKTPLQGTAARDRLGPGTHHSAVAITEKHECFGCASLREEAADNSDPESGPALPTCECGFALRRRLGAARGVPVDVSVGVHGGQVPRFAVVAAVQHRRPCRRLCRQNGDCGL